MTPSQSTRFYFPAWTAAFKANWHTEKGRISPRPGRHTAAPDSGLPDAATVEQIAQTVAAPHHRAPTADDLRYACHTIAVGTPISSKRLTSPQVNRVVALFRLLTHPDHISITLDWLDADKARRQWLVRRALSTGAHDAYIHDICLRRFASDYSAPFWENLPLRSLEWLARRLVEVSPKHPEWRKL